jgi:hypothetical protein
MAFNIASFQAALTGDGARPNLFEVRVPVLGQDMTFMCKAAQIPGSTLGLIEQPYFGRTLKLPGNRVFAEWTVTILNDENFKIRRRLEDWSQRINSHVENLASGYFGSYIADAEVVHYGKTGNALREGTYLFKGMWPQDLSPIDLDWGNNDVIEEYTVTFQYQYWTPATQPG